MNQEEAFAVISGLRADMLDGYAALKDLLSELEAFDEQLSNGALEAAERAHDRYYRVISAVHYLRKGDQLLFRRLDASDEENILLVHARALNAIGPDLRPDAVSMLIADVRDMAAAYQAIAATTSEGEAQKSP